MRILFLALDTNIHVCRGDGVHVRELAQALVRLGHEVRVLSATRNGRTFAGITNFCRPDSTLGQLAAIRKHGGGWAQVIYERRMSPKISFLASALNRIPFVVEVNGILDDELRSQGSGTAVAGNALRTPVRGLMLQAASHVVAVSDGIREDLIRRYRLASAKVSTIPNGANIDLFRPSDKQTARARLGLQTDAKYVSFVGNLVAWQGVETLIRACASLRDSLPTLHVLIVGDGPEAGRIRSLAEGLNFLDRMMLVGSVPYVDVPIFINASDVCAAPFTATRKASPIKVYEALACARPVVASDVDGVGGLLRSWSAGLAVEPENPPTLAHAIEWMLNHPDEAVAMGTRGREHVVNDRSWDATARAVAGVLEKASVEFMHDDSFRFDRTTSSP